jgi:putative radical SAM enzyme (TIGR03279 family)
MNKNHGAYEPSKLQPNRENDEPSNLQSNNRRHEHRIQEVKPGSIGEEMEIEAGDYLLSVNGETIEDIFDYQFLVEDEYVVLLIRKPDGEEWELEIEKDYSEDIGLVFENSLMDEYHSCRNKCMFCFIDQMPPNMRPTLYFKDDDSRLSFLQGNYITLTNMSEKDIDRIIRFHLAPINISVHTTNPQLRCKMLSNRFAGEALNKINRLYEAGIPMNGQIVLCKGVNDGEELRHSIEDLLQFAPHMQSVSVVPVGLTKYREGLYPLEPFNREDAQSVLELIHQYQNIAYERFGMHFIHASDEWYILAGMDVPEAERYDGYIQYENGVGMVRLFRDELEAALKEYLVSNQSGKVTLVTAKLIYPTICWAVEQMQEKFPNMEFQVVCITNHFFGEQITVAGLLTAQDIYEQLKDRDLGDCVILPGTVLKADEDIFLDDWSLDDLQKALQVDIHIVKSNGMGFLEAVTKTDKRRERNE